MNTAKSVSAFNAFTLPPPPFTVIFRFLARTLFVAVLLLAAFGAYAQTPMVCGVVGSGSQPPQKPNPCPTCPTPTPSCFEVQNIRVNIHFFAAR